VRKFLSGHDLAGKSVAPFMTHEGTGLGRSTSEIAKICPASTVLEGLAVRGSKAGSARKSVLEWLRQPGMAR
jgi:hypothetical protein